MDSPAGAELSPSVSIAILNYQRRDALREALESARSQRHAVEILAVDNASTDGSAEMVRDEFPDVRLVRLPENIAAAARNVGVASAKGDVVFTLDNDVRFSTPDDVTRGLEVFRRHPRAAVVNFMIVGPDGALCRRDWCHPRDPRQLRRGNRQPCNTCRRGRRRPGVDRWRHDALRFSTAGLRCVLYQP